MNTIPSGKGLYLLETITGWEILAVHQERQFCCWSCTIVGKQLEYVGVCSAETLDILGQAENKQELRSFAAYCLFEVLLLFYPSAKH